MALFYFLKWPYLFITSIGRYWHSLSLIEAVILDFLYKMLIDTP